MLSLHTSPCLHFCSGSSFRSTRSLHQRAPSPPRPRGHSPAYMLLYTAPVPSPTTTSLPVNRSGRGFLSSPLLFYYCLSCLSITQIAAVVLRRPLIHIHGPSLPGSLVGFGAPAVVPTFVSGRLTTGDEGSLAHCCPSFAWCKVHIWDGPISMEERRPSGWLLKQGKLLCLLEPNWGSILAQCL